MALNDQQRAEAQAAAENRTATSRPTVAALEAMLHRPIPVLDHGFVRVVDYMGDDGAVVQAARVSYGKGTRKVSEDAGLIRYLLRHRHTTPFEMCELKLHVKLPVFVARQWIRHRTANVNEISARYSVLDREFYLPAPEHLAAQSAVNRQGRGEVLEGDEAAEVLDVLKTDAARSYDRYLWLLNRPEDGSDAAPEVEAGQPAERRGLARELARMNLPLSIYTQWYWKVDLHNLLHFLALRADPHAQYEIRAYADAMLEIVAAWVPVTYQAFLEYRHNAMSLSAPAVAVVRAWLAGTPVAQAGSGLSPREWRELCEAFDRPQ